MDTEKVVENNPQFFRAGEDPENSDDFEVPVHYRKRAKICFGLGDVYYIGLLDGDVKQIMSVIDELSTTLCEDIGLYWFNHADKKYERVSIWSEME